MACKRVRSREDQHDAENMENPVMANSISKSGNRISSSFDLTKISRVFTRQFLSDTCSSFKTPNPPNPCTLFINTKPTRPTHPNKCQKRWDSNELGLGIFTSNAHKPVTTPKTMLDNSYEGKNNIVQRYQYMVINREENSPTPTSSSKRLKANDPSFFLEFNDGNEFYHGQKSGFFYPTSQFMSYCCSCGKKLNHEEDIYIYRGDKAFCSEECRDKVIYLDNIIEKKKRKNVRKNFIINSDESLFSI